MLSIESLLLRGSESRTVDGSAQRSLEAAEMGFVQRMLQISGTAKITIEECMRRPGETKKSFKKKYNRQCTFIGHPVSRGALKIV